MRQFTAVSDVSDPITLAEEALAIKANPFAQDQLGNHKTMVLLFFNPSLRTRLSTQKAGINLGMSVISMNAAQGWQLEFEDNIVMNTDKAEHIRAAAAVVSQYGDIIGIRTFPSLTDKGKDYSDFIINKFSNRFPNAFMFFCPLHFLILYFVFFLNPWQVDPQDLLRNIALYSSNVWRLLP